MTNKDYEIIADAIVAVKRKYPLTHRVKQNLIDEVVGSIEFEFGINGKLKRDCPMLITDYVYKKMEKEMEGKNE